MSQAGLLEFLDLESLPEIERLKIVHLKVVKKDTENLVSIGKSLETAK